MTRIGLRLFLLSTISFGVCVSLSAQSGQSPPAQRVKIVPAPLSVEDAAGSHVKALAAPGFVPSDTLFSVNPPNHQAEKSIRVLSEAEMTSHDRDLVADAESSIRVHAGTENLEVNNAGWTYHQLECRALPNHLFLRFTRNNDTRQMSMFSAAIPRNGEGRVHIIPIVRKGYSLFSPAAIGPLTIAAFNRIRTEEGAGASADWLGTALCYGALTGANPQAGVLQSGSAESGELHANVEPTLVLQSDGGAIIRFVDVSDVSRPMEWKMMFDRRGKLLKATHAPAYMMHFGKRTVRTLDVSDATK